MATKNKKPKSPPEPYWDMLVGIWFQFTQTKFNVKPSFDGSAPRDLKNIIHQLRKRCEEQSREWTELSAHKRFLYFLEEAYQIPWLRTHWTLFNINRQKDIVFFNAAQQAAKQIIYNKLNNHE